MKSIIERVEARIQEKGLVFETVYEKIEIKARLREEILANMAKKKLLKVIVSVETVDCFGNLYGKRQSFTAEEWNNALAEVQSWRWGNTQYITSVWEEAAAKLIGGSTCNCSYDWRRVYKMA